jgi:glycerol-3-phosphate acyltransferase PlsY
MSMWADAVLVLGAYLVGAVPQLAMLARLRGVRLEGDFHEGLWEQGGRGTAVFGVLVEFVKGALPVLVGRALGFSPTVVGLAGVAAVAGQMWPVFSRFDGEKGNTIGVAVAAALAPLAFLAAIVPMLVALGFRTAGRFKPAGGGIIGGTPSRSLPLGMMLGFLVFPLAALILGEPAGVVWCGAALWLLLILRRLTAGLNRDLRSSSDTGAILLSRFLYDRPAVAWRRSR